MLWAKSFFRESAIKNNAMQKNVWFGDRKFKCSKVIGLKKKKKTEQLLEYQNGVIKQNKNYVGQS